MADLYTQITHAPLVGDLAKRLGMPVPTPLERYSADSPVVKGPVYFGEAPGGRLRDVVRGVVTGAGQEFADAASEDTRPACLVFDATGISESEQLRAVYDFFHPVVADLQSNGRVVVLGTVPEQADTPRRAAAQQALEGFVRSLAKELRGGSTANLVRLGNGADESAVSTLRFLLSARSVFVNGQSIQVMAPPQERVVEPDDVRHPLAGRTVLVTGAARGIGAAMARVLARDGAHVVCLDMPSAGDSLSAVANEVGGSTVQLDLTSDDAPRRLADHLTSRHGGVDVVVHNAGITRDKTIVKMTDQQWDMVMSVNLTAQERVDDVLLDEGVIREGGRIISVSSIGGIAGNRGQTNYGASKAGVIGRVRALAPLLHDRGITVNAVAPGFIETQMTAEMPVGTREAGRRLNSLSQGGQPEDVAEAVAWFAAPGSAGVTGNVTRVCGQSLIGA